MVRNAYVKETGLDTLEKILTSGKPVRILMKPQGSNVPPAVDTLLAAYGIDRAKIRANGGDVIQVDTAQTPAIMRDGRADLLIDTVLRGHPMITEIALTADVRFLDIPPKGLDALAKSGVKRSEIPQWFKGQDGATKSGDFGTVLITHRKMPDELAYNITKTVIEKMPRNGQELSGLVELQARRGGQAGKHRHPAASGCGALLQGARLRNVARLIAALQPAADGLCAQAAAAFDPTCPDPFQ